MNMVRKLSTVACLGLATIGLAQTATTSSSLSQNAEEAKVQSSIAKANSNARVYQTALETFFIDYNSYPAYTTSTAETIGFEGAPTGTPSFKNFPVAKVPAVVDVTKPGNYGSPPQFALTTPISYLNKLLADPFSTTPTSPFAYFGDNHGYLVWSAGPDGKYDIDWEQYDTKVGPTDAFKVKYTYDPTNGAVSSGDIWRGAGGHNLLR